MEVNNMLSSNKRLKNCLYNMQENKIFDYSELEEYLSSDEAIEEDPNEVSATSLAIAAIREFERIKSREEKCPGQNDELLKLAFGDLETVIVWKGRYNLELPDSLLKHIDETLNGHKKD